MLAAQQLINGVVGALREVIGPAVTDPYVKSQAYMAAVILEFVVRQLEQGTGTAVAKQRAVAMLFTDLSAIPAVKGLLGDNSCETEADLCRVIQDLYSKRAFLGEVIFTAVNERIRRTLRELLDEDLKVSGAK